MNLEEIKKACKKDFPDLIIEFDSNSKILYLKNIELIKRFGMKYSWNAQVFLSASPIKIKFECETGSFTSGTFVKEAEPSLKIKNKFQRIFDLLAKN